MPAAVYPALQSVVLLCIDDNEDVLECEKYSLYAFPQFRGLGSVLPYRSRDVSSTDFDE